MIEDFPVGLDETYARCLMRIDKMGPRYHDIATKAFKWVAEAKRPLSSLEMRQIVSIESSSLPLDASKILNSNVTDYCGNLLTTDLATGSVTFTHSSVTRFLGKEEFLQGNLSKYLLKSSADGFWCGQICLSYIKTLYDRKQPVLRRQTALPGNIPSVLLSNVPGATKIQKLKRLWSRSPETNFQVPISRTYKIPIQHDSVVHDYIMRYWLEHISEIAETDAEYDTMVSLCKSPIPEFFPWLDHKSSELDVTAQLLFYAVMQNNVALLRVLSRYKTDRIGALVRRPWRGTTTYLIHMAAALGLTSIIQELSRVTQPDVHDLEGKTPLAWAAEHSRTQTIQFLLDAGSNPDECYVFRREFWSKQTPSAEYSMSLVSILAYRAAPTVLTTLVQNNGVEIIFRPDSCLSQALFGACISGRWDVAAQLKSLGADDLESRPFRFPGREDKISGNLLLYCLLHSEFDAANILLSFNKPLEYSLAVRVIQALLDLSGQSAIKFKDFLCSDEFYANIDSAIAMELCQKIVLTFREGKDRDWKHLFRTILQHGFCYQTPTLVRIMEDAYFMATSYMPDDVLLLYLPLTNHVDWQKQGWYCFEYLLLEAFMRPSCRFMARLIEYIPHVPSYTQQYLFEAQFSHQIESIDTKNVYEFLLIMPSELSSTLKQSFFRNPSFDARVLRHFFSSEEDITAFQAKIERLGSDLPVPPRHIAFRCLRQSRGIDAAVRLYRDLFYISPDFDLSLNFPAGYWEVGKRYTVKLSIIGALYKWNWRLRRRKNLEFSAADIAYSKAVPECLEGLESIKRIP